MTVYYFSQCVSWPDSAGLLFCSTWYWLVSSVYHMLSVSELGWDWYWLHKACLCNWTESAQKLFASHTANSIGNYMILELSRCHLCIAISHLGLVFHSPTMISSIVLIPRLCCVKLSPHTESYPIFCLFLGQTGSHLSFGVTATYGWAETMSLRTYLHELVFFSDLFLRRRELKGSKAFSTNTSMISQSRGGIF